MTCAELKDKILTNTLTFTTLVLKYSDNLFLANQYVNEIVKNKKAAKIVVDNLGAIGNSVSVFDNSENIYIYYVDKLSKADDISELKNTIIVCKDIEKDLAVDFIELPALEDWQIKDYIKTLCKGFSEEDINWLYSVTKGDIYRINNECNKFSIFNSELQSLLLHELIDNKCYDDLNPLTIFNFTYALLKKDLETVKNMLRDIDNLDIEGTGVVTILRKNLYNLINVQMNKKATPELLGITQKQFNAIKWNVNKYTNDQLIRMFEFITTIDYKLKTGALEMTNNKLVEYMTCHLLTL